MILVELLNSLGISLSANSSSSAFQQKLGGNLTIAALVIQLAIILIFIYLAAHFQRRCTRAGLLKRNVKTILRTLYLSMMLILARCIFRLVEHTGNTHIDITNLEEMRKLSPLLRYEVYFFIFEATLMLLNSVLWSLWHPGRFLPRRTHVYLSLDGAEVEDQEDKDDRSLWMMVVHTVSFGLLFAKNPSKNDHSNALIEQRDGKGTETSSNMLYESPNKQQSSVPRYE